MNSAAVRHNLRMVQGLIQSLSKQIVQGAPVGHTLKQLEVLDTGLERIIERSELHDREAEADKCDNWIAKAATNRRAFGA